MHIYYDIVEDANVHAGYYTSSHDHVNVCELMATILWQASRSVGYNFAAKLGPANDKCYGWRCPCKRPQVHDLLSQLGGVHSHSIDEEHYYDADGNHYGSWQLHQLPLPRLKDVVAIRAFGLDSGAQLNTVLDLSLPKRHTTQASIVHPPPLAPPSPHKVMEAVEEPPFGDRGHVVPLPLHDPQIEKSSTTKLSVTSHEKAGRSHSCRIVRAISSTSVMGVPSHLRCLCAHRRRTNATLTHGASQSRQSTNRGRCVQQSLFKCNVSCPRPHLRPFVVCAS